MTKKAAAKKTDTVSKALKAALNRRDTQFSVDGKTYRIAKDAGIIRVKSGGKS